MTVINKLIDFIHEFENEFGQGAIKSIELNKDVLRQMLYEFDYACFKCGEERKNNDKIKILDVEIK